MDKYDEIKKVFQDHADSDNAAHMEAYMKNRFRFYGIKTPLRKEISKEFIKEEKKTGRIDWDLCWKLFTDEYRELNYLSLDIMDSMKKKLVFEDIDKLYGYAKTRQWWDTIDRIDRLMGDIGLHDKRVNDIMLGFSKDEDFWLRRLSIDHQLGRKDKTDTDLLEKILVNNLGSKEFFINKAIGWSLREFSKTDSEWVRNFIKEHSDRLSSLSLREGSKYL